jgi:hypothetical protein
MRDLMGKSIGQTIALKAFDLLFNKPTEQGGWSYVWATMLGEGRAWQMVQNNGCD